MVTLQVNNYFFNLDIIFTYPIDLTGDGGAWSTDFELPVTREVLQAFELGGLSYSAIDLERDGILQVGGPDSYPCKVRLRALHDELLEGYITLNVLPVAASRVVAEIAATENVDLFSDYQVRGNMDFGLSDHHYECGHGPDIADGVFYQANALYMVNRLATALGLTIDTTPLVDLWIVPDRIMASPGVKQLMVRYSPSTPSYYIQPSYYYEIAGGYSQGYRQGFQLRMTTAGTLRGVRIQVWGTADSSGLADYDVLINGTVVQSGALPSSGGQFTISDITYNTGDVVAFCARIAYLGTILVVSAIDTPTAPYNADQWYPEPRHIPTIPNEPSGYYVAMGAYANITCTFADLLADLAAVTGTVLNYQGGRLTFAQPQVVPITRFTINGYILEQTDLGKTNVAVYANDANDDPHRDILSTYTGDTLDDVAELIHMHADQADTLNGMAYYPNFDSSGTRRYGNGYWIGRLDSRGNLQPTAASSPILPTASSQLLTIEATIFEDVSRAIKIAMAGREWLITEREQSGDGVWNIRAILQ